MYIFLDIHISYSYLCESYTESPEQYFPMTLQNQITSLAIPQSHLLSYSQGYYLVFKCGEFGPCGVIHPFHEEMLRHREYPMQTV